MAFATKPTARTQTGGSRVIHAALSVVAIEVGFVHQFRIGALSHLFVPDSPVVGSVGLAMTLAGIAFAIWARFYLGDNWGGQVTLKEDHSLVTSGPYAIVRHPIDSGLLVALLGTAVAYR